MLRSGLSYTTSCLCTKFGPILMLRLGSTSLPFYIPAVIIRPTFFYYSRPLLIIFLFARSLRSREIGSRVYSFVESGGF